MSPVSPVCGAGFGLLQPRLVALGSTLPARRLCGFRDQCPCNRPTCPGGIARGRNACSHGSQWGQCSLGPAPRRRGFAASGLPVRTASHFAQVTSQLPLVAPVLPSSLPSPAPGWGKDRLDVANGESVVPPQPLFLETSELAASVPLPPPRNDAAVADQPSPPATSSSSLHQKLRDPQGTQLEYALLHRELVAEEARLADDDVFQEALRGAQKLLEEMGPARMHEIIRCYINGEEGLDVDVLDALGAVDVAFLTRANMLLEDLPRAFLEKWFREPELFVGNCTAQLEELFAELYGKDARFPLLLNTSDVTESVVTERRRQLAIERKTLSAAVLQYRKIQNNMEKEGRGASMSSSSRVWTRWVHTMTDRIRAIQEAADIKPCKKQAEQLLADLPFRDEPELLGVITCQTVLNLVYTWRRREIEVARAAGLSSEANASAMSLSIPFVNAVVAVGEAVEREAAFRECESERRDRFGAQKKGSNAKAVHRELLRRSAAQKGWDTRHQIVPIGAALVDMLIACAAIEVDKRLIQEEDDNEVHEEELKALEAVHGPANPGKLRIGALVHTRKREGKKTIGYIRMRPAAYQQMNITAEELMTVVAPKHQPMLVEPRRWRPSGVQMEGGYLMHKVPFVRTANKSMAHLRTYSPQRAARVMDALGRTPWRVNQRVLDCMEEVVRRDLAVAEVPPKDDPEIPVAPADLDLMSESAQKDFKIRLHNATKRKSELQSDRPTFQLKLQVARDFAQVPRMYFPHNVDFRGRAYPVPPHLNHISDDICRGLLMFAEPKPLGDDGLYWLKISLANLLGKDKLSFEERIAYVDASKEWIMEVAKDPLGVETRERWIHAGDGPWQVLARCFELADCWSSGDDKGFLSYLPVHLDGSCNGLQHYAALGRDELGGMAVNLTPSDRPQDVYSVVLGIVKRKVREHCVSGTEAEMVLAQQLESLGLLQRKVVKRTVMTICYGVTRIGANQQVKGEIEDMVGERVDPEEITKMAVYLAGLILRSIDEVFERAMLIKRWFDKVSAILNTLDSPVSWQSPIGLACVQPYKKARSVQVRTDRQRVSIAERDGPLVNKSKQRMGFPPNFIHSLDATHMMMTAEAAQKHGIYFAGVHDSFWTHAADVPVLHEIIREAFIDLHSRPLLEELYDDMRLHMGAVASIPPLPKQGSLDISLVRDSLYIFS